MSDTGKTRRREPTPLVLPFPKAGPCVEQAYWELSEAATGSEAAKAIIGRPEDLARPWDPPTCGGYNLRQELWLWFNDVVDWINHEYVWDPNDIIPTCWPQHPHLVHEIAVLADRRRSAGLALTSHDLEYWHRDTLPQFTQRMRQRATAHCEKEHHPWPGQSRYNRQLSTQARSERFQVLDADLQSASTPLVPGQAKDA